MSDHREDEARAVLADAVAGFGDRLALACSFQKESSVLLHLLLDIDPDARVFTLDTHVLFPETYAVWQEVEERYGIKVEVFEGPALAQQAAEHGHELWHRDPDRCCSLRKVAPLDRALSGLDAWVAGLRREQGPSRARTRTIEWDRKHELWKVHPLAAWTEADVWEYINRHDLPYNALHDRGYASIGCTHCTMPGHGREGRWAGLAKTECGLHQAA